MITNLFFFNRCFDKSRLKILISWSLKNYGEKNTIELVENLKQLGFQYATQAGISLSLDDLKIPPTKSWLVSEAEIKIRSTQLEYQRGHLTAVEKFQQLIDTWHRTSETLKQNVVQHFRSTNILNPVYMMAFSGARGNLSQVRQLVGMRGLMADPQGQIIDFPIRSNFREGLTLTEYVISCYGARKGLVDTALRTANSGYLTRRLVDVSQHVIVCQLDCGTRHGIFLSDMKQGQKTILSLENRLIGRVLAENINFFTDHTKKMESPDSPMFISEDPSRVILPAKNSQIGISQDGKLSDNFQLVQNESQSNFQQYLSDKGSSQVKDFAKSPQNNMFPLGTIYDGRELDSSQKPFDSQMLIYKDSSRVLAQAENQKLQTKKSKNKYYFSKKSVLIARNQEISASLAAKIVKLKKKVLVRSPLTCEAKNSICQLCYGWSLAHGNLVSLGEAVGILAAQSIGEPGTQLTMRTFHTGGVFSGDVMEDIRAPFTGSIQYSEALQGILVRTPHGKVAFLTKTPGELLLTPISPILVPRNSHILEHKVKKFRIPNSTILFVRENEVVFENQLIAEFSSMSTNSNQRIQAKHNLNSELEGQVFFEDVLLGVKIGKEGDVTRTARKLGSIWVLSGKLYQSMLPSVFFPKAGDLIDTKSLMNQTLVLIPYNGFINSRILNQDKTNNFFVSNQNKSFNISNTRTELKSIKKNFSSNSYKTKLFSYDFSSMNIRPSIRVLASEKIINNSLPKYLLNKNKIDEFPGNYLKIRNFPSKLTKEIILSNSIGSLNLKNIHYKKYGYFLDLSPNLILGSSRKIFSKFSKNNPFGNLSEVRELYSSHHQQEFSSSTPFFTKTKFFLANSIEQEFKDINQIKKLFYLQWFSPNYKTKSGGFLFLETNYLNENSTEGQFFWVPEENYKFNKQKFFFPNFKSQKDSRILNNASTISDGYRVLLPPKGYQKDNSTLDYSSDRKIQIKWIKKDSPIISKSNFQGNPLVFFSNFSGLAVIQKPKKNLSRKNINTSFLKLFKNKVQTKSDSIIPTVKPFFNENWKIQTKLSTSRNGILLDNFSEIKKRVLFTTKGEQEKTNFILTSPKNNPLENLSEVRELYSSQNSSQSTIFRKKFILQQFLKKKKRLKEKFNNSNSYFVLTLSEVRSCSFANLEKKYKDFAKSNKISIPLGNLSEVRELDSSQEKIYFFTQDSPMLTDSELSKILSYKKRSPEKKIKKVFCQNPGTIFSKNGSFFNNSYFFNPIKRMKKNLIKLNQFTTNSSLKNAFYSPFSLWIFNNSKILTYQNFFKSIKQEQKSDSNQIKILGNFSNEYKFFISEITKSHKEKLFLGNFRILVTPQFPFSKTNILRNRSALDLRNQSTDSDRVLSSLMVAPYGQPFGSQEKFNFASQNTFVLPKKRNSEFSSLLNYKKNLFRQPYYLKKGLFSKEVYPSSQSLKTQKEKLRGNSDINKNTNFLMDQNSRIKRICHETTKTIRNNNNFIQVRIKPGWIYFPKNQKHVLKHHKSLQRPGSHCIDDILFDQHMLYVECISTKNYPLWQFFKQPKKAQLLFDSNKALSFKKVFQDQKSSTIEDGRMSILPSSMVESKIKNKNLYLKKLLNFSEIATKMNLSTFLEDSRILPHEDKNFNIKNESKQIHNIFNEALSKQFPLATIRDGRKLNSSKKNSLVSEDYPIFEDTNRNDEVFTQQKKLKRLYQFLQIFFLSSRQINKKRKHLVTPFKRVVDTNQIKKLLLKCDIFLLSFYFTQFLFIGKIKYFNLFKIYFIGNTKHRFYNLLNSTSKNQNTRPNHSFLINNKKDSRILLHEQKKLVSRFFDSTIEDGRMLIHEDIDGQMIRECFTISNGTMRKNPLSFSCFFRNQFKPKLFILLRKASEYTLLDSFQNKKLVYETTKLQGNFVTPNFENFQLKITNLPWLNKQKITNLISTFPAVDFKIDSFLRFKTSQKSRVLKQTNFLEVFISFLIPSKYPLKYTQIKLIPETIASNSNLFSLLSSNFVYQKVTPQSLQWQLAENSLKSNKQQTKKISLFYLNALNNSLNFSVFRKIELSSFLISEIKNKNNTLKSIQLLLYSNNWTFKTNPLSLTCFFSPYEGEITNIKTDSFGKQSCLFLTNNDQLSFSNPLGNLSEVRELDSSQVPSINVGQLMRYGEEFMQNVAITASGQIIQVENSKVVLRKAQPALFSSRGVFHVYHKDFVEKNSPLITLFYQRLKTGDIVQGIPQIEQFFEARQTKEGEILPENLHNKLREFFEISKQHFSPQEAARKSLEKIQQILVDGVQKVYQSQGVTIADKHLEVIVRQMTSKVKILEGGQTGLLRGELIDLDWIEVVNKGINSQKAEYEPVILGITKAALETESFISAASFQETTRILARAAIERKTDFLRGLKENVILGHLIPAGTGFSLSFDPEISKYSDKTRNKNDNFFTNVFLNLDIQNTT